MKSYIKVVNIKELWISNSKTFYVKKVLLIKYSTLSSLLKRLNFEKYNRWI